jgi:hypothetical protein
MVSEQHTAVKQEQDVGTAADEDNENDDAADDGDGMSAYERARLQLYAATVATMCKQRCVFLCTSL